MKPLIIRENKAKYSNFEKTRLRKNLKGSLELNNFPYLISFYDEGYTIAHFVCLAEYKKYRSSINEGVKVVLSVLYAEEDCEGRIFSRQNENNYVIEKSYIELINEVDLVLVPSNEAKVLLEKFGVKKTIKILSPSVNVTKFSIANTYVKNIAYRYLKCPEDMQFIISIFDHQDIEAAKKIRLLAEHFPKLKFIGVYHCGMVPPKLKKIIKKPLSNLIFTQPLDEDIYVSLAYNAKAYLFLGSSPGNVIECYEAMASETQIIALKSSIFTDIIIDKENGYVYNDFASLEDGLRDFVTNKLESTIEREKEIAKNNSLKVVGEKLIQIYNDL